MQMPGYPPGVPNPLTRHVHPYPTRFHGSIYTRPVFGFPFAPRGVNNPMPQDFAGLGDYDVSRGIFRPGGYGGGVFDGNIAGLGDTAANCIASYCKDLAPDQMQVCLDACNAQAKAPSGGSSAAPASVPITVSPGAPPSAAAAAQAALYSPSSNNKWLAFAVGGAAALGVLIYLKKRKKG